MIKALKPFLFGLLLYLYMQADILIQIKAYDSAPGFFSYMLTLALPIIFGFVIYCKLKKCDRNQFWITLLCFVVLYIRFLIVGYATDYFKWLFNLTNLSVFYDDTYYELGVNAILDGAYHTISMIVVCVVYLVKTKRRK